MRTTIFATTAALLLASAGMLAAQAGHGGHGAAHGQQQGSGCPMHAAKAAGPQAALQHREHLGLSAEQVQRLEAAHQRVHQSHQQTHTQMSEVHRQLTAAGEAARFDEQAARAATQRAGQLHADMLLASLRAQNETRGILTAQQRQQLAQHAQHHGGEGGSMGMQCSMMGGGAQHGHGQGSQHRHNH